MTTTQICACEGLDPKCKHCFGSGYVNVSESRKPAAAQPKVSKSRTSIAPRIHEMTRAEMEAAIVRTIAEIDAKSKKQMQLLNSISFSTNTFRRDFKDKFANLHVLEDGKRFLRGELELIFREIADKKYAASFHYEHFLSDKDIDIDSNRELKGLIKSYRKLKDGK